MDGIASSSVRTSVATVNLHVAELTVESSPATDRYRLAEGFEAELRQLFVERGVPASLTESAERDRVDAACGELSRLSATGSARAIAGAVYEGLGGSRAHLSRAPASPGRGGV
jgi:hypothetical protein